MQAASRWLLTLYAIPSVLLGQNTGPALKAGDRVRITAQADTGIYVVRAVSSDTLTVQLPRSEALAYFSVTTLRRVDVSRGRENRAATGIRRGLIAGLAGAALGGIAGLAMGDDPPTTGFQLRFSARDKAAIFGVLGGGLGFVGGFISGLTSPRERWEGVLLPSRVSATVRADGVFALSYAF